MSFNFDPVSATGYEPEDIYAELGGEQPAQQNPQQGGKVRLDPRTQPIHFFGGSVSLASGASGTLTATPSGITIRPDSIEFSDAQAALLTVTSLSVGGMPVMHGGSAPGDAFKTNSIYKLRPALPATPNSGVVMGLTTAHTATVTYTVACKGPASRQNI